MTAMPSVEELAAGVRAGDRSMLGRAITLVESVRPEHQEKAERLLQALVDAGGRSHRIGITGVPGVGKSTLIDRFGLYLIEEMHRVAVLAVDPSSLRTGGAILGDKTRMQELATSPHAFIRPSPTAGTLGGVARRTRETIALVEAAGFDIVIVETVGVGQSEVAVADMVDVFVVLMLAGGGDELQGIKKGIVELADIVAVNKADGDNVARAQAAAADYRHALELISGRASNWRTPVLMVSALESTGLAKLWGQILAHKRVMTASGQWEARRHRQSVAWMRQLLSERVLDVLSTPGDVAKVVSQLEADVGAGVLAPRVAVARALSAMGLAPAAVGKGD